MKSIFIVLAFIASLSVFAGCQQKMADQPSYKPLEPSDFFSDGRSARPAVARTVARGHLRVDTPFFTGRIANARPATLPAEVNEAARQPVNPPRASTSTTVQAPIGDVVPPAFRDDAAFAREFPVPVSESMVRHGYNRYMIYCVVCHDPVGTGRGRIIERGYSPPPSIHVDRLRNAPVGRLYAVISEGYGSMPSYASQIPPEDRWAIVAYMRALQLSQHFPEERLTREMRNELTDASVNRTESAQ